MSTLARPTAFKNRLVGRFELKSKDEGKRTFEGVLSTSHLDSGNGFFRDIVWPKAFESTLAVFRSGKGYIPLLDSHDPTSVFNVLGHMLDAEERLTGKELRYKKSDGKTLVVPEMELASEWQVIDGIDGDRLMDRLRPGSLRKMSMGYDPLEFDFVDLQGEGKARNLREVQLGEGSLVVFAMNDRAEVDLSSVKALHALRTSIVRDNADIDELETLLTELDATASSVKQMIDDAKAADSPADSADGPDTSLYDWLRLRRIRATQSQET